MKKLLMISIIIILLFSISYCTNDKSYSQNVYIIKPSSLKSYLQPLIVNDYLINVIGNKIICFSKEDGKLNWDYILKNSIIATPTSDGEFIYVVTSYELVSIDISTGKEVWRKESTDRFTSEAFYYKGNLYILSEEKFYSIASKLETKPMKNVESVGQVHINQILDFGNLINEKIGVLVDYISDKAFLIVYDNKTLTFNNLIALGLESYNLAKLWSYKANGEITSLLFVDSLSKDKQYIYFVTNTNTLNKIDVSNGSLEYSKQLE